MPEGRKGGVKEEGKGPTGTGQPPWAMPDTCRRIAKGEEKAHLEAQNNPRKKICMYPKSHHMYSSHN